MNNNRQGRPQDIRVKLVHESTRSSAAATSRIMIPVIFDVERKREEYLMARVAYLACFADEFEMRGWAECQSLSVPVAMLGVSGVLCMDDETPNFYQDVDNLRLLLDPDGICSVMNIDLSSIWIPAKLLRAERTNLNRGDVFAIELGLFSSALTYSTQQNMLSKYYERETGTSYQVDFLAEETDSFCKWCREEFQLAKEHYIERRKRGKTLEWKDGRHRTIQARTRSRRLRYE